MNVNTSFIIGIVIGAVILDYIETKIRAYKAEKTLKTPVNARDKAITEDWKQYIEIEPKKHKTIKPLSKLRKDKAK